MPSTASKKEKQKTAVEYELNSSIIAVVVQRKKSARSSMISSEKKTSRRKVGARFAYKSFTRKATEKMQAITSQFAACLYYTNCLPQYYTHVSLLHCQNTTSWSRWVLAQSPYWRSPDGVQSAGATMSRVECTAVHQHNRLHESLRPNKTFGIMVLHAVLRHRTSLHQTSLQSSRRNSLNRQREWHFPDQEGDEAGRSIIQPTLQYSVTIFFGKWPERWQEKQKGIRLSDKKEDCLTNLRSADDVLVFSTSLED